ncbi:hypothetical protein K466DRAFT_588821 [Polyporus arcularius HHB13444]|uniref:DUF6533 domain-containing protein n=1 Tax=Polyporus arcularius HHB13444 TaxID=1314778 RepID=A0A5C3P4F8_9APHY|nr:hypothetical protein K466DRAFT_588821 [Polyporus arcularius HHB13444]
MSVQAEIAAVVSEADSIISYDYCAMAAIVLYVYDYLITFPEEVASFWKAKPTGATVLFFLTRYTTMAVLLFEFVIGFIQFPGTSCVYTSILDDVIETMQYLPWAGFAALRAYALSRNRPLSVLVFLLSSITIVVNMLDTFKFVTPAAIPFFGCTLVDTISPQLALVFASTARGTLIAADAILIVITWAKLSRRGGGAGGSFVHVVLRDGTLYFICLLILNTLHLAFTVASIATPVVRRVSNVIAFSEPLTAMLIYRFMLNLQAVNRNALQLDGPAGAGPGGATSSGSCGGGSLVFERVIGSLGSSVLSEGEEEDSREDAYETCY